MDDLALVRRLRSELAQSTADNERLRHAVNEAADKFHVLSFYIRDPEARKCAQDRRDLMEATLRQAG